MLKNNCFDKEVYAWRIFVYVEGSMTISYETARDTLCLDYIPVFTVCKYINKIQIKKYLVNIIQFIKNEQKTTNRSNSTACGSWQRPIKPGRIIGLYHFFRYGQPVQGAFGWDVLWNPVKWNWQGYTRKQWHFWWITYTQMKKYNCEGQETWRDCLLQQLKLGAQSLTLQFWDSTF